MKVLIETDERCFLLDVLIHAALRAAQEGSGGEFGGSKHSSPAGWVVTGDAAAAKQGLDMHRLQAVPWTRLLVPQKLSCCCLMGEKTFLGLGDGAVGGQPGTSQHPWGVWGWGQAAAQGAAEPAVPMLPPGHPLGCVVCRGSAVLEG